MPWLARRLCLGAVACLGLAAPAAGEGPQTPPAEKNKPFVLCQLPSYDGAPTPAEGAPNIVVIAVDTLRADRLGVYGHSRDTSPRLDELAAESLVFDHAIAAAPWTTPSFAAVFTGQHPAALGMGSEPGKIPTGAQTLTEALSDRGYATAGVVSHFFVGEKFGFHRGFDYWDQRYARGHQSISSDGVQRLGQACLNELSKTGRPFFLFAHFFDPHYDYLAHDAFPFHRGYTGDLQSRSDNFQSLRRIAREGKLSSADRDHLLNLYDSEIGFTDSRVGRLLDHLKALDLYDNTLIVFLSDHGEMFGERSERWIGHTQYLFDELVRVPLIIKSPKAPFQSSRGRVLRTVSLVDLMPTVIATADSQDDPRSLLSRKRWAPAPVFSQTRRWRELDAMYLQPWKLVLDRKRGRYLLYDLSRDPGETNNLARPESAQAERMMAQLDQWLQAMTWSAAKLHDRRLPTLSEEELRVMRSLGYIQ